MAENTREMARLEFGSLREASDFTPLLAEQLDAAGDAIGVNLLSLGRAEVATAGGRSIDILAQVTDGPEFVIANQYGRADHDHLTRGLAHAVARNARGLVVIAENHRDEFRAVAQYLNELAEHDAERGIAVWLVEARAVRIGTSPWAPLFTTVEAPNSFTARVERAKQAERAPSLDEFLEKCESPGIRQAWEMLLREWRSRGHIIWRYTTYIALAARGPAKNGERSVLALYPDGQVAVPFGAYAGANTGIAVPELTTTEFRTDAARLFGFSETGSTGRTELGWLDIHAVDVVSAFACRVADAYAKALVDGPEDVPLS